MEATNSEAKGCNQKGSTQRINSGLRVAKMDGNVEGRAKGTQSSGTQQTDFDLRAVKTNSMPRVMSGKNGGLDKQRTTMLMVVPKTAPAHSGQTLV